MVTIMNIKKILSTVVLSAMFAEVFLGVCVLASEGDVVYLSCNGKNSGTGTYENPVNTIEKARNAALEMKSNGSEAVKIRIGSGEYYFYDTLQLTEEDSGISYIADGEVVFHQSVKLNKDKFVNVTDPQVLLRLDSNVRPYVLQYDLSSDNIDLSDADDFYPYLYINNEKTITARYPNGDYLTADNANATKSFNTGIARSNQWKNNPDAIISGSLSTTYFWRNYKITSIAGETVTLENTIRKNAQYYADRILEELDLPGEYYVDRENNILYYYPTESIEEAEITIKGNTMIKAENVSNATLSGITFKNGGGVSVSAIGCSNFDITGCNFYNIQGENVLNISGSNCTISGNYAYNCDDAFIKYEGGNLTTLAPGNIIIENNRISNCGNFGRGNIIRSGNSVFGMLTSCGNIVRNNIIQDCMVFTPIVFGGNNYTIEKNELYNVGRLINDGGAIYFGRSNVQYGNKVVGNYIHDLNKDLSYCGIYSDDGYCGAYVQNNVIARADQAMIINIGMNNKFIDNLFIDTDSGITGGSMMGRETGSSLFTETYTALYSAPYKDAFKKAYPQMLASISRTPFFAPYETYITGNVMIGEKSDDVLLRSRHSHFYSSDYDTDLETLREKGAVTDNYKDYLGNVGTRIDDLTGYAPEVKNSAGEEMNGTPVGNPYYQFNEDMFKDAANQDYTLVQQLGAENSLVGSIDMSDVGVFGEIPGENGQEVAVLYPKNNSVNVNPQNIALSWSTAKNASIYKIKVSQNSDMSNPVIDETVYETYADHYLTKTLSPNTQYYAQVEAQGIGKQDSFTVLSDIISFKTAATEYINVESLKFATQVIDAEYEKINNGDIEYEENAITAINSIYEDAKGIIDAPQTQESVNLAEQEIYDVLIDAEEYKTYLHKPEISQCSASETDKTITISGRYFPKNSLVSVLVTNPQYNIETIAEDLNGIQYASVAQTDTDGNITFSFDTIVNGNDMPGEYTVYLSDENGVLYRDSYTYAHIEIGDIKYYDENMNETEFVSGNNNITMKCNIKNRTDIELKPVIITSYYSTNKLCDTEIDTNNVVAANSTTELTWKPGVQSDVTGADSVRILFWDSLTVMKPLSTVRVIYKTDNN